MGWAAELLGRFAMGRPDGLSGIGYRVSARTLERLEPLERLELLEL